MKVYIMDLRSKPRIVFIDGQRYIFPSKKEVLREISKNAFTSLSQTPYLKVRVCEDGEGGKKETKVNKSKSLSSKKLSKVKEVEPVRSEHVKKDSCTVNEESIKSEPNQAKEDTKELEIPDLKEKNSNLTDSSLDNTSDTIIEDLNCEHKESNINDLTDKINEDKESVDGNSDAVPEENLDFMSMSKKELRALIESKGKDTTGMTKALMIEWLLGNNN